MRIRLEQKKCIGCGSCPALDPENFRMVKSKAEIVDGKEEDEVWEKETETTNDTKDAVDSCPTQCIHLEKE